MDYTVILKRYWGYDSFRGVQKEIIESIGSGEDTLGLMPTGGGKSITFQVPAMAMKGTCLVITPLIALMKDQVQNLREKGIRALAVHAGMTRAEVQKALNNCVYGCYKFLYISPERLETEAFRTRVKQMDISMITVDESHCISQWGYDFRPSYLKIAEIRDLLPGIPVLALTATATPEVVDDIQRKLHFARKNVFRMSFERQNLAYIVRNADDKQGELLHILRRTQGSAIVYVRSRRRATEVAELLNREGLTANFYHAGLEDAVKDARQQSWQKDEVRVMVATNAFGMGIDKPNVRLVVHIDLPDSIEAYFQEAGRAGRDGQKAWAVLLHNKQDNLTLQRRIPDSFPEKQYILDVYEKLQYYYQMPMGGGLGFVKAFNLNDFCVRFKLFPVPADSALKILSQAGYLNYTSERDNASRLMFTIGRDGLYQIDYLSENSELIIQTLLRTYTGLFTDYAYIEEEMLATRTGLTREQIYHTLQYLSSLHILSYIPRRSTPYIIYTRERMECQHIYIPPAVYEERKERLEKRINAILAYADDNVACRSRMLLRYFGEDNPHNCGQCDNCLKLKKKPATTELQELMLSLLSQGPVNIANVARQLGWNKEQTVTVATKLLDTEQICMENGLLKISAKH